jgi:hypothetical protein
MTAAAQTASFRISFAEHERFGRQADYVLENFGIVKSDNFQGFRADQMVAALPQILRQACVKAAARHVSYEDMVAKGKNDSAYLDLCDRLATGFRPTAVAPVRGMGSVRFRCNGIYLNGDGDGWTGLVEGCDEEEAKFQAKWQMALASAGDPSKYEDFADIMDGCAIDHVAPEPVTTEEIAMAAAALLFEVGSSTGEAWDRVAALLDKLGMSADTPARKM